MWPNWVEFVCIHGKQDRKKKVHAIFADVSATHEIPWACFQLQTMSNLWAPTTKTHTHIHRDRISNITYPMKNCTKDSNASNGAQIHIVNYPNQIWACNSLSNVSATENILRWAHSRSIHTSARGSHTCDDRLCICASLYISIVSQQTEGESASKSLHFFLGRILHLHSCT